MLQVPNLSNNNNPSNNSILILIKIDYELFYP